MMKIQYSLVKLEYALEKAISAGNLNLKRELMNLFLTLENNIMKELKITLLKN